MDRETGALDAVVGTESVVRAELATRLERAIATDSTAEARLRSWGATVAGDGPVATSERAAARQANWLTNLARYRAVTGREPPPSLERTPVTPFRGLDVPTAVEAALEDLRASISGSGDLGADQIGVHYETALSGEERRTRGQFYTPRGVADAASRWALAGTDESAARPRVLDPAAGTGTFPLAVEDVLADREPGQGARRIRPRTVAVDVDETALRLAELRLSARRGGGVVDGFDGRPRSFFDLDPGPADAETTEPEGTGDDGLGRFDAVVGNPPFVRAGDLVPGRAHFREHLDALGPPGETPYADGDRALSGRSDASVYFVTHATRFLRPGGRLAVVLPAKWLESEYGVPFRRFLADHYRVHAVVGFDALAFDALVDTVLLLAERRAVPQPTDHHVGVGSGGGEPVAGTDSGVGPSGEPVRFVRLDGGDRPTASLEAIAGDGPVAREAGSGDGSARVVERSHSTFATARQCSPYLRAPEALLPLLSRRSFVDLGDLADVRRGVTTGANRFFLLDPEDRERWGIDPAVLRPAVRSIRGVERRTLAEDDVDQHVLDVHGVLAAAGGRGDEEPSHEADPTARAKAALRGAGHDAVVEYVEDAETEGVHEGRTCRSRRVWFDLGELPTPDAFVPKLLRERVFTVRNEAGAVPSNAIDCLAIDDDVDPAVLLGVLDSSLSRAMMEVWGRDEAGMLQLMTAETRTLPVPDVRRFSADEAARIREAAARLDGDGDRREDRDAQADLDAAVVDAVGLDLPPGRIRTLREELLRRRVERGDRDEASRS